MDRTSQGILGLPNEILLNVFSLFNTRSLIDISCTCHRFHSLVVRVLQQRLQIAAGLDGHTLYLECGPPAQKWTTSKVFCLPLGTNGLSEVVCDIQETGGRIGHVERMNELYTRFRPVNKEPDFRSVPRPHPAGDIPGSRTYMTAEDAAAAWKKYTGEAVTRPVHIDASFLFSQLETVAYLGRREVTRGLLFSIQEVCEGTIRVWRDWLSKQCEAKSFTDGELIAIQHEDLSSVTNQSKGRSDSVSTVVDAKKDPGILWLNTRGEHVGIKFRVREQMWRRDQPVLFASEMEAPVSYKVELEEVVIKTTHLLLKLEESRRQILNQTGRAMIIGSYVE